MGAERRREADQDKVLAGKSTLHRLEHGQGAEDRDKKIVCDVEKLADLFVKKFIRRRTTAPVVLVNDRTLDSWSRARRVVGKAEQLAQGGNPRFVVTSLDASAHPAALLYEEDYCGRGDMENRIKEQPLDRFADRTSTATMKANQMRLWLSSVAYRLLNDLRELGLKGTRLAAAQCGTIRTRLMKIGAAITVSVRRVWVRLARSCPYQDVFTQAWKNLIALGVGVT